MPKLRRGMALAIVITMIAPGIACAAETTPGPVHATPVTEDRDVTIPVWAEQWQPERDQSDTRLAQAVTIWEKGIRLAEALEKISKTSGVSVECAKALRRMRVTVVGEGGSLAGLMLSLSDLFDGYWVYGKEEAATQQTYLLVEHHPIVGSYDEWEEQQAAEARRRVCAPLRPEWEARLDLYQHALTLSPEEVLRQYEELDPWLCATLLDPQERPKIEAVCSLEASDRERLIAGEGVTLPLAAFSPAFGQYLQDSLTGMSATFAAEDGRPRTVGHEHAPWSRATVSLAWEAQSLSAYVASPGLSAVISSGICLSTASPRRARERLVALGYAKDTPERRARVAQEEREWQAAHPTPPPERISELVAAARSVPSEVSDARLEHQLDLSSLTEARVPMGDLLELAAKQCGVCVVAQARRRDQSVFRLPQQLRTEATLGNMLAEIGKDRAWSWRFRGVYLVVSYQRYRADAARELPPEFVSAWQPKLRAGNVLDLDELATALAGLNRPQVARVNWALRRAGIAEGPTASAGLRSYGRFGAEARQRLRDGAKLRLDELGDVARREVTAGLRRPWLTEDDLRDIVLSMRSRDRPHEGTGLSLVAECDLPDFPNDGVTLFTCPQPLRVTQDAQDMLADE